MNRTFSKRKIIPALLLAIFALTITPTRAQSEMTVWKSPSCGCCKGWVEYLRENGLDVTVNDANNLSEIKQSLGLNDSALYACHTATIGGYVIEGHVPISDIRRLLAEQPNAVGITAPGMPMMSPGMRSIKPSGYDVLLFDENQQTRVFSSY